VLQNTLSLIMFLYHILLCTVLWLVAWFILRQLDLILLMMFFGIVNLSSLPLQFIVQQFFILFVIFKDLNFKVFSFPHHLYWSCMLILMQTGLVILQIVSPLQGFVSFLETLLSFGKVRNNTLATLEK